MLFTSSFKLLGVAAFLLPALLVGASPHSLSARAGTGEIRHLKLFGFVGIDSTKWTEFKEVILQAKPDEPDTFIVESGWMGKPAEAKAIKLSSVYSDLLKTKPQNLLAHGHDRGVLNQATTVKPTYYLIFESDEVNEDSDESDDSHDTIKPSQGD